MDSSIKLPKSVKQN
jgi:hypothetical protein